MPESIPISIVFEDDLQLAVVNKLLEFSGRNYVIGNPFIGYGFGYIKKRIANFNHAAIAMPYLIIIDLDDSRCAPEKIREWLGEQIHPNLLFRIAVHDVEAWILADYENAATFLGVSQGRINRDVESLPRAKTHLLQLVSQSRKGRAFKNDMLPQSNSTAKIGPNYNYLMSEFVKNEWNPDLALQNSDSLRRAIDHLRRFTPQWRN